MSLEIVIIFTLFAWWRIIAPTYRLEISLIMPSNSSPGPQNPDANGINLNVKVAFKSLFKNGDTQ